MPAISEIIPKQVHVYVHGACVPNPGPGGWAWATKNGDHGWGRSHHTTNNEMELRAAVEAIESLLGYVLGPLLVLSESEYLVRAITDDWCYKWKSDGWRNYKHQKIANYGLWAALFDLVNDTWEIEFRAVRPQARDEMSNVVGHLAGAAARGQNPQATRAISRCTGDDDWPRAVPAVG